jgi:hypothetical protein
MGSTGGHGSMHGDVLTLLLHGSKAESYNLSGKKSKNGMDY